MVGVVDDEHARAFACIAATAAAAFGRFRGCVDIVAASLSGLGKDRLECLEDASRSFLSSPLLSFIDCRSSNFRASFKAFDNPLRQLISQLIRPQHQNHLLFAGLAEPYRFEIGERRFGIARGCGRLR